MIRNPFAIILLLLFMEGCVLFLSGHSRTKRYFRIIPAVFWIYFVPMLVSTFGLIDSQSWIFSDMTKWLLPASLFLLLLPVDIRAILRLGGKALTMMLAGSLGIMLGTVFTFKVFFHWIGKEFWSGFGALSASWSGGSANMIAVKEAMATPDRIFLPMVVVDTVVPYLWMGILVAGVIFQPLLDRWLRADQGTLKEIRRRINIVDSGAEAPLRFLPVFLLILVALAGSWLAQLAAARCPEVPNVLSAYAWTIIIISFVGVMLSLTPVRQMENLGASRVGYFLLYFVLTSIGAKASLANIGSSLVLILAGFLIVIIHMMVLMSAGRAIRAPMFLLATASQANIGGPASAPIVAEIYQPGLASVGLLLAILGNILGTYLGIVTAQLCRWVVNL